MDRKPTYEELEQRVKELEKEILKKKQTEEELRKLSSVVDAMVDGVTITDLQGKIVYLNRAVAEQLGYKKDELIGKTPTKFIAEKDLPRFAAQAQEVLSGKQMPKRVEYLAKDKEGKEIPMSISFSFLYDPDGKPKEIIVVSRDILDRKQAEEALRGKTHNLGERVKELDCLYSLSKLIEKPGILVEEILQGTANLIPPAWQYPEITCARIILEAKEFKTENFIETTWKQTSNIRSHGENIGTLEVYYLEKRPERDEGPFLKEERSLINAIAERLVRITERRRAEETLRESQEKLNTVISNVNDVIFQLSPLGLIQYVSPKVEEIYGYKPEELIGKHLKKTTPVSEVPKALEILKRVLSGKRVKNLEINQLDSKGKIIPMEINVTPIKKEGKIIAVQGVMRDISERLRAEEEKKQLEAQLQQAQKLESIGVLAAGMAHDFNNLLTRILGNIDIAKDYLEPGSEIYNILSEAEEGCMRGKGLTQRFRTFSGDLFPSKETDSLVELIKDSTNLALSGSNVRSEFFIPDDLWLVEFDKEQMKQVINNLILNADEAMPEGGIIRISGENLTIEAENKEPSVPIQEGKYVKISIQDEGFGISEEHLPKIFDPYFSTKEIGIQQGMGLGLTVAYSIIKKHNGYIYVDSKVGVGTTVYINIPAFEEEIQEKE